MSPRKPAVLRGSGDGGADLREHLIAAAAALIAERGTVGLAVRDIARAAGVADGALYNYFEDKEDLLAHALLAHVGNMMAAAPALLPEPGTRTLAANLCAFIDGGIAQLARITPAFAGLMSVPKVLVRFHEMVGGGAAFGIPESGGTAQDQHQDQDQDHGENGLPALLLNYLRAEQRLGRVAAGADAEAAAILIVGAMHGQILPRLLFSPPGTPIALPPGLADRMVETVLRGIAP